MIGSSRPVLVDENNERFKCTVCCHLIIEPYQSVECGHRACRSCFEGLKLSVDGFCPGGDVECGLKPLSQCEINPDIAFYRELTKVKVWCTLGCNKQMKYGELVVHLVVCEQRNECRFGCGATFEGGQFAAHEDTCCRKPVPCDQCQQVVLLGDLQKHKMRACPESIDSCSAAGCNANMRRRELGEHVARSHKWCRFRSMGCYEEGTEEHLAKHEQEGVTHHWSLVADYIETLKVREETETQKLAKTRFEQALEGRDSREELRSIRAELLSNAGIAQETLDVLQAMKQVPDVLQAVEQVPDALFNNLLSLAGRILIVETKPNKSPLSVTHEAMLNNNGAYLDDMDKRVQCLENSSFENDHIIVKFKNYNLLKAKIESGELTMIDSHSFYYTDSEGDEYKLLLRLHPAGCSAGAGTHMSAELVAQIGNCDEIVKWPFKPRKVTLRLRGMGPGHSNIEAIVEVGDGLARPLPGMDSPVIGCSQFAPRDVTEDSLFYDFDEECFFVEIVIDTGGSA